MEWEKLTAEKNFLVYGKFTEPDKKGIIIRWAKTIKKPSDVFAIVDSLTIKNVDTADIPIMTASEMAKKGVIAAACAEQAILCASILKTAGIPTGIMGAIKSDSLFDSTKYPNDNIASHIVDIVYWKGKWHLLDSGSKVFSAEITATLTEQGFLPCKIWYTDFSEEDMHNRIDTYWAMVAKVAKILGLKYQMGVLHPKVREFLENETN
ncbi:MAG: hypothetical protein J4451_02125 [DPANN group archaeon]|nr:hypothetical protein [DPANN group archaeon]